MQNSKAKILNEQHEITSQLVQVAIFLVNFDKEALSIEDQLMELEKQERDLQRMNTKGDEGISLLEQKIILEEEEKRLLREEEKAKKMERSHDLKKKQKEIEEKEAEMKSRIQSLKSVKDTKRSVPLPPPSQENDNDSDLPSYSQLASTSPTTSSENFSSLPKIESIQDRPRADTSDFYEGGDYAAPPNED